MQDFGEDFEVGACELGFEFIFGVISFLFLVGVEKNGGF